MPRAIWVLFLLQLCAGRIVVELADWQVEHVAFYEGQYACIEPTVHSSVDVLRMALTLCNVNGSADEYVPPGAVLEVVLHDAGRTWNSSASIPLPYLRDVHCSTVPYKAKFTSAHSFALSPSCCCTIPSAVPCFWVQLANASDDENIPPPATLTIVFQQQHYSFELASTASSAEGMFEKLRVKPLHRRLSWWSIAGFLLANVLVVVVPYSLRCRKCRLNEEKSLVAVY